MRLDPTAADFAARLADTLGMELTTDQVEEYRES